MKTLEWEHVGHEVSGRMGKKRERELYLLLLLCMRQTPKQRRESRSRGRENLNVFKNMPEHGTNTIIKHRASLPHFLMRVSRGFHVMATLLEPCLNQ